MCGATGLLVFFIKDSLEYLGFIVDKKTNANRALKTYKDILDHLDNIRKKCLLKAEKL